MPISLFKKVAAFFTGGKSQPKQAPSQRSDKSARPGSNRKNRRSGERPGSDSRRTTDSKSRTARSGQGSDRRNRPTSARDGRQGAGSRVPQTAIKHGTAAVARPTRKKASPGASSKGLVRPGGALSPEEVARNQEAHRNWDPASYQVPEAEGKVRFGDLGLPGEILHAVADLGFEYCTPIQALSLRHALEGKNVTGRAQTGTGKTAAFLIAVLTRYLRNPEGRNAVGAPRALILAPTRELVIQICKDAEALGKYCGGIRSLAVYGGMDYERQREEVSTAPLDLLVATPGRLLDFCRRSVLDLSRVDTLVIDEADRMLDMGFIPDVKAVVRRLPAKEKRSTMLFSATLTDDVLNLAGQWMVDPVKIEVEPESVTTDTVRQVVYIVRAEEKFCILFNLIQRNPGVRIIVFCNRKSTTEYLTEKLRRYGLSCAMLSGDVSQDRRLRVLEDFRAGKVLTVVATDVAGRGIHVDDIGFVVNFDFPYEAEDYVHRIGRTGRAGQKGTAISFADENESFIIPDIEKYINEPLKCSMPEEELVVPLPPVPRREERPRRQPSGAPRPTREASAEAPAPASSEPVPPTPADAVQSVSSESVVEAESKAEAPATVPAPKAVRPEDDAPIPAPYRPQPPPKPLQKYTKPVHAAEVWRPGE